MKKRLLSLLLTATLLVSLMAGLGLTAGAVTLTSGHWVLLGDEWFYLNGSGSSIPEYDYYHGYYNGYYRDYWNRYKWDEVSHDASFYYDTGLKYDMDLYVGAYGDLTDRQFKKNTLYVTAEGDTSWAEIGIDSSDTEDVDVTIERVVSSWRTTDAVQDESGRFRLDYGENDFLVTVKVNLPVPNAVVANSVSYYDPDYLGDLYNLFPFLRDAYDWDDDDDDDDDAYSTTAKFHVVIVRDDDDADAAQTHTITTSATVGGTAGSETLTVDEGGSATIQFTPYTGYAVAMVLIDGKSQGTLTSYTFRNVTEDHTVKVYFAQIDTEPALPDYQMTFTDVSDSAWYYKYVYELCKAGIISGYPDNTFRPDGKVTWGEALKLVMLAAGYDEQAAPAGQYWAAGYMNKAIALGILDKEVDLKAAIDRKAMAALTANALGLSSPTDASPFADTKLAAAVVLYEAGVVTGSYNSNGELVFKPNGSLTRAEFSAIIYRIYQLDK